MGGADSDFKGLLGKLVPFQVEIDEMIFDSEFDGNVRAAAFRWLEGQVAIHGETMPHALLQKGFDYLGDRVPLMNPAGIFRPRILSVAPLTIRTSSASIYEDGLRPDGLLHYSYRGTDPEHPDNRGLRFAMTQKLPLIYLHQTAKGRYLVTWPVYVVSEDRLGKAFVVNIDLKDGVNLLPSSEAYESTKQSEIAPEKKYIIATVRRRQHQRIFRSRVLDAYRQQCAFCRFRHMLDAAHIIPDSEPGGDPSVSNGLALCSLHHAAFDQFFIGVRPDHTLEVREDVLNERDGPTLAHAIQALHGQPLVEPVKAAMRPRSDALEFRYEQFKKAPRIFEPSKLFGS